MFRSLSGNHSARPMAVIEAMPSQLNTPAMAYASHTHPGHQVLTSPFRTRRSCPQQRAVLIGVWDSERPSTDRVLPRRTTHLHKYLTVCYLLVTQ
jgi:hypothetical protein